MKRRQMIICMLSVKRRLCRNSLIYGFLSQRFCLWFIDHLDRSLSGEFIVCVLFVQLGLLIGKVMKGRLRWDLSWLSGAFLIRWPFPDCYNQAGSTCFLV